MKRTLLLSAVVLMGTFFTRDILETANFIDYKIKRQIERHGFKRVFLVNGHGGNIAIVQSAFGEVYAERSLGSDRTGERVRVGGLSQAVSVAGRGATNDATREAAATSAAVRYGRSGRSARRTRVITASVPSLPTRRSLRS